MAIITPSAVISEVRGSIGTETFSRNHYRNYVRTKTNPIQPDTTPQVNARTIMATASAEWGFIEEERRIAWNEYARDINSRPRLSSQKPLTGFNAWCQQYILASRGLCAFPYYPNPEKPLIAAATTNLYFGIDGAFVQWDLGYAPTDYGYQIWMCAPASAGVMSFNSVSYRVIAEGQQSVQGPTVFIQSAYETVFGILMSDFVGKKIFTKLRLLELTTGHSTWQPMIPTLITEP